MRTGRSGLDLHVPAGSLATLEDMIAAGQVLTLLPNDELDKIHRAAGARTAQDIETLKARRERAYASRSRGVPSLGIT